MGKALLQKGAVGHNCAGEIGQILFAEKGQRYFPQPFGQCNAPYAAFSIGGKVGSIILNICGEQNQPDAHHAANHIKRDFLAGNTAA